MYRPPFGFLFICEPTMQTKTLESLEKTLRDMRDRISGEAVNVSESIRDELSPSANLSSVPIHLADVAQEGVDANVRVLETERGMLEEIDGALARIENGQYGTCEKCGSEIAEERLKAIPYVSLCIRCAAEGDGSLGRRDRT
jgi:RNA polymerase-binding protein DksA